MIGSAVAGDLARAGLVGPVIDPNHPEDAEDRRLAELKGRHDPPTCSA